VKRLQYQHYRLDLQLGKSHTTRLTSPRHSYTDSSHQDSLSQPSLQPPAVYTRLVTNRRLVVTDFTKLTQTSVPPHTCLQQTCVSILPQNILVHPTLVYLSSIFATLPQFFLASELCLKLPPLVLLSKNFPSLVVHPCALIGTPRVIYVKHCILWVFCAPSRTITLKRLVASLREPSAPKQAHAPINRHLSWTSACPFPCVDRHDSSWVCQWGHPTSPLCPCCQGQMGPLLGHAPKLPRPYPNSTQVFFHHSKESKVCDPLVLHITIVRPRYL
jgi:hypothetical protein